MQCIVLPTTALAADRSRLLHWSSNFNKDRGNCVGGVLTVSKCDHPLGVTSRSLKSILSGEEQFIQGSETDIREQYGWAREEIVCSFKPKVNEYLR